MLGVVVLMMLWLTPEITFVGRSLAACNLVVGVVVTVSIGQSVISREAGRAAA